MSIRLKILIYFSTTVIALTTISSFIIYLLFAEYREEEFQQRQKEKIRYTLGLLAEYKHLTENLSAIMDKHTIHDFYDEKMLIFDKHKQLIYKSIDDLPINNYAQLLNELSPANPWVETKEKKYDIIAVYIENESNHYYAISKAYDAFGYTKLAYLRNVLIVITIFISITVVVISFILSRKISNPITALAEQLSRLNLGNESLTEIAHVSSSTELRYLTDKFNQLIKRTNEAFAFQKHTIHHISHQLKTPVAILVLELERLAEKVDNHTLKAEIEALLVKAKSLGNIIKILLEIAKTESGQQIQKENLRVDELVFDVLDELRIIYPHFHFDVNYEPRELNEQHLIVQANSPLLKQALHNVLANCISFSDKPTAQVMFDCREPLQLVINISNSGKPITPDETKYLFNYFFRGKNSLNKTGFGLGLVLSKKILALHNASIAYHSDDDSNNVFSITIPQC